MKYVGALLLVAVLTACTSKSDQPGDAASPQPSPIASPSAPTSSPRIPYPSLHTAPISPTAATPSPSGTTTATPSVALLDWTPIPGPTSATVTVDGSNSISVSADGSTVALTRSGMITDAGGSGQVLDALLDDHWAVWVRGDPDSSTPSLATVTELGTGKTTTLDASAEAPTVSGGTWALFRDRVVHATTYQGKYCLASVDLNTLETAVGYCASPRSGFNYAHLSDQGDAILAFDDHHPSCRTVLDVSQVPAAPFPGVPDCMGAEGVLTADGAVWAVVPKESQYDNARFYARDSAGIVDLGPGTTNTLTPCGTAVYFVRDSQTDTGPAELMQWRDQQLTVVFRSKAGPAFLSAPRCAGSTLSLTSQAQGGDQQVTAVVP